MRLTNDRTVLVAVLVLGGVLVASAGPGTNLKALGQFDFYGNSSRNSLTSARAHAGTFRTYAEGVSAASDGGHASPIVAKEASDSIGHAVAKSETYVAAARKHVEPDAQAAAHLDAIAEHLADVKRCCADLAECCVTDRPDAKRSAECCRVLDAALAKAITAHDPLVGPAPTDHPAHPAAGGHHDGPP